MKLDSIVRELNKISHELGKTALSELQEKYRDYFMDTMDKHEMDGLSDLTEEQIKEFFNDISKGWVKGKGPKE